MTKKPRQDVRHLDIRHSFELRHSVFIISLSIFALIRMIRGKTSIGRHRQAAAPRISGACAPYPLGQPV
jgi:hypothetical protein